MLNVEVAIVGSGGSEAAWQLSTRRRVDPYEMRPQRPTPAHKTMTVPNLSVATLQEPLAGERS